MGVTVNTKQKVALAALAILAVIAVTATALIVTGNVHLWEDGSWAIGQFPYPVSGCLPWGICN